MTEPEQPEKATDNVINIKTRASGEPRDSDYWKRLRRGNSRHGVQRCKHINKTVDRWNRVLECDDCEAQLDPIEVLHEIAGWNGTEIWREQECRRLDDEIQSKRREVKNLKASIRRHQKKST